MFVPLVVAQRYDQSVVIEGAVRKVASPAPDAAHTPRALPGSENEKASSALAGRAGGHAAPPLVRDIDRCPGTDEQCADRRRQHGGAQPDGVFADGEEVVAVLDATPAT